jgi:1,4-dihydroxy-6-naphthoate synthase
MINLGFSPCPNDTFIFYALANKKTDLQGLEFSVTIEDVETLNRLAVQGALDVTKISCHAYCHIMDDYTFLKSGGAFGKGCGPLLISKPDAESLEISKIAIPGELTTAFLLLKLYLSSNSSFIVDQSSLSFVVMPFNEIMASVADGKVDAGLIIHESRFTYQNYGLTEIVDLGSWWEKETGLPIPLGGIAAKKSLGDSIIETIENIIQSSVKYSMLHKGEAMPYIKQYSQELTDDVIDKHIGLYVNDYTLNIGIDGEDALDMLIKMAKETDYAAIHK